MLALPMADATTPPHGHCVLTDCALLELGDDLAEHPEVERVHVVVAVVCKKAVQLLAREGEVRDELVHQIDGLALLVHVLQPIQKDRSRSIVEIT